MELTKNTPQLTVAHDVNRKTICLVIICRNEEDFILPALQSVEKYIDYWIVVDSESDDETVHLVNTHMSGTGIPGELITYYLPFRGDEKRTFAINAAKDKADYILVMDADNILQVEPCSMQLAVQGFPFHNLEHDAYYITKKMDNIEYPLLALYRGDLEWEYVGIIHDYPQRKGGGAFSTGQLQGVKMLEPSKASGPRMKTQLHFYNDALMIEREIMDNPELPAILLHRYTFYLAQSYRDAGMVNRSIDAYQVRVLQEGWPEEVFYSLLTIARLKRLRNDPPHEVLAAAMKAWNYRPQRLEAAYLLMELLCEQGNERVAWSIGTTSSNLSCDDKLFLEYDTYRFLFPNLFDFLDKKNMFINK